MNARIGHSTPPPETHNNHCHTATCAFFAHVVIMLLCAGRISGTVNLLHKKNIKLQGVHYFHLRIKEIGMMHTQRKRGAQWQLGLVAIRLLLYAALYWGYNGISNDRYETTFFQFWLLMIAVELSTFLVSYLPSRFWKTKRADGETTRQRMISERPYNLLAMGVLAIHAVTVAYPVHKLMLNFWIGYSILPVLSFLVLLFLLLKYLLSR